jgi:acetylornithine deacetylase
MGNYTVELLRELVAIDSVNPSLVPGGAGENQIGHVIAGALRAAGLDTEVAEVAPGRPNVIGILEGKGPGLCLMFCGHLDTVGVAGMQAPFTPVERDGRLYGRGAQDMKGGLAAMVSAARTLARSGGLKRGRLIIAGVVDEEYESIGAEALVQELKADAAVVTEPTDLQVAVGHKGFSWVEIVAEGRAAHGSRPQDGRDAILRMGRILGRLEELDRALQAKAPHPIQGTASLHASFITGGRELSTYPDRCVLQMERRSVSGEAAETALDEAQAIIAALRQEDPEFAATARFLFGRLAYETPSGHFLPGALEAALAGIGRQTKRSGMSFWTDAAVLGHAGIPSVIFGPGGEGLHGVEEYVRLEEVLACHDALVELARALCR